MSKLRFNPGHSKELERLGIFNQSQKEIEDKDLIDTAIEKGEIAEVFFLLSQQLRNDIMKLHLIGYDLDDIGEKSKQIKDEESLTEVESGLNRVLDLLFGIAIQSEGSSYCCTEIQMRVKDLPDSSRLYTEEARENKKTLDDDFENFSNTVKIYEDEFIQKITNINSEIQEAKEKFKGSQQDS